MLIEVARAHAQRRQVGEAVAALLQAEQITPNWSAGTPWSASSSSDLLTMQDPPALSCATWPAPDLQNSS